MKTNNLLKSTQLITLINDEHSNNIGIISNLLENKDTTNTQLHLTDCFGTSPILACTRTGNYELFKLLIEYGADINHKNLNGENVFHYMVAGNQYIIDNSNCLMINNMINYIIDFLFQKDNSGITAFDLVKLWRSKHIFDIIRECKTKFNSSKELCDINFIYHLQYSSFDDCKVQLNELKWKRINPFKFYKQSELLMIINDRFNCRIYADYCKVNITEINVENNILLSKKSKSIDVRVKNIETYFNKLEKIKNKYEFDTFLNSLNEYDKLIAKEMMDCIKIKTLIINGYGNFFMRLFF